MIDQQIEEDWDAVEISELEDLSDFRNLDEPTSPTSVSPTDDSDDMDGDGESLDVIIEPDAEEPAQPGLKRWIAAIAMSLLVHTWMGSTLSSVPSDARTTVVERFPLETRIDPPVEPEPFEDEPEKKIEYELANPNDEEKSQLTAVNARSTGLILSEKPVEEAAEKLELASAGGLLEAAPNLFDIPEGMEIDETVIVQGTTGEGLVQMDAALDRVTWEVAANLKDRKVLIVWLVDASGSLLQQRKVVTKRMRRIYSELQALGNEGKIPNQDQPVLSAVVSFGLKTTFVVPNPTPNVDEIVAGLERAPIDESGVENVFGAVRQVIEKYQTYRTQQGRRILLMTITDEAGDDYGAHLNTSINMLNRLGGRAYVIGPAAVFGKRQGFVPYLAPEDGKTYQIPVDIGPESAMAENVQLPFWFNGPQYENLSSGLGPYALARLVHETGGVYFMTNMTTTSGLSPTGTYSNQTMKLFAPDYRFGTPEEYLRSIEKYPLRVAVYKAGQLSLRYKALGTPDLELRVNPQNYIQTLATAQQTVAVSTAMIDTILSSFNPNLEQAYAKETSLRWKMAYNLCYGRLLAQRLRCLEYNTALAQFKLMGAQEVASKSNHWIFRPDTNINYAAGTKKQKDLAETLLKRCVADAPGTPWAILAARELQYPFGIKVIERFEPPPPPPPERPEPTVAGKKKGALLLAEENKKKKQTPPPAPPPPPKLPKF